MVRSWFILALAASPFMSQAVVADEADSEQSMDPSATPETEAATDSLTLVECSSEHERGRYEVYQKSKCEAPIDVLVDFYPKFSYKQYMPNAVRLKRCSGVCLSANNTGCVPTETRQIQIPIRVYNVKTDKEMCSTYPVEEHVTCGCGDEQKLLPR